MLFAHYIEEYYSIVYTIMHINCFQISMMYSMMYSNWDRAWENTSMLKKTKGLLTFNK